MSKTAKTHYKTKKDKKRKDVRAARAVKNSVSDAAGAMDSSEQTVLSSAVCWMTTAMATKWHRPADCSTCEPCPHRKRAVSDYWQARHRHDETDACYLRDKCCAWKDLSKIYAIMERYSPQGVFAIIPNTLNVCGDLLSIVNFEALLLLNGSRQRHTICDVNVVPAKTAF